MTTNAVSPSGSPTHTLPGFALGISTATPTKVSACVVPLKTSLKWCLPSSFSRGLQKSVVSKSSSLTYLSRETYWSHLSPGRSAYHPHRRHVTKHRWPDFFFLLLLPSVRQLTHAACRMHEWLIRERQPRGSCRSRHIHESLRRETAAGAPSTARQCRREVSVVVTTHTYKPSFATLMTLHPELPTKFLHTNGWSMQPWTC